MPNSHSITQNLCMTSLAEDRMFIYDAKRLVRNVDERSFDIKVLRGIPFGSKIYKLIYVSSDF